jgi:hypothetical protein
MHVVRTEGTRQQQPPPVVMQQALTSLVLQSLDSPDRVIRFDGFATEELAHAAGSEVYQLLFETQGQWRTASRYAVYAIWKVRQAAYEGAFIESRRQLFEVRRGALPTFAYDWLLKDTSESGRYMVLGLYGDEAGATRLCREHPQIQQFIQTHPADQYTAQATTGLCCFQIV